MTLDIELNSNPSEHNHGGLSKIGYVSTNPFCLCSRIIKSGYRNQETDSGMYWFYVIERVFIELLYEYVLKSQLLCNLLCIFKASPLPISFKSWMHFLRTQLEKLLLKAYLSISLFFIKDDCAIVKWIPPYLSTYLVSCPS